MMSLNDIDGCNPKIRLIKSVFLASRFTPSPHSHCLIGLFLQEFYDGVFLGVFFGVGLMDGVFEVFVRVFWIVVDVDDVLLLGV